MTPIQLRDHTYVKHRPSVRSRRLGSHRVRRPARCRVPHTTVGPESLSLALGGRNEQRLRELEADLAERQDGWTEIPVVLGEATVPEPKHRERFWPVQAVKPTASGSV